MMYNYDGWNLPVSFSIYEDNARQLIKLLLFHLILRIFCEVLSLCVWHRTPKSSFLIDGNNKVETANKFITFHLRIL